MRTEAEARKAQQAAEEKAANHVEERNTAVGSDKRKDDGLTSKSCYQVLILTRHIYLLWLAYFCPNSEHLFNLYFFQKCYSGFQPVKCIVLNIMI